MYFILFKESDLTFIFILMKIIKLWMEDQISDKICEDYMKYKNVMTV